ncbi:hypothetical protein [Cellulomonas sp. NPDC089187]|uniref:hypothetical protein n=1 Tax=Cellulomonas sp. NPDC089187 TaxID=3154970 RepID=UPI003419C559
MLSDAQRDELVAAVLQSGLDDWVALGEVDAIALFYKVAEPVTRSKMTSAPEWAIEPVIRHVVERGLMLAGEVYSQGGFVAHEGDREASIVWMMDIFREAGDMWPFAAWLALTDEGEAAAKTLPRALYLDEPWPDENGALS